MTTYSYAYPTDNSSRLASKQEVTDEKPGLTNDKIALPTSHVTDISKAGDGGDKQEDAAELSRSTTGAVASRQSPGGTSPSPTLVNTNNLNTGTSKAASNPTDKTTPASGGGNGDNQFHILNGQIIDPSGKQFIAKGINVFLNQVDAAAIVKTFPGINAVRLATTPDADLNAIDALVQGLTSKGVVVNIEDHSSSGGNPNTLSGQALTNETIWYARLAGKYQANPYVWFGTANEPDNSANLKAVTDQEKAIYDAIRGTGSKAIVMLEERGGFTNDAARQSASDYAGMRNVVWDTHYYGWITHGSTDMAIIAKGLQNQIADAQSVKSGDGTVPVIIAEYGPSTSGIAGYDANGLQVVQAIHDSGYGTMAWAWSAGTDTLISGGGKTDFGLLVAQHIG